MAYRRSDDDLAYGESYGERWDRNRFAVESDRARPTAERERFEERDRMFAARGPGGRIREASVDERFQRKPPRPWDEEPPREKRYYDDEAPRFRRSPPPELERRLVFDRERDRDREYRRSSPPRRPGQLIRRQSSLDTFDRRPPPRFVERDEYSPPPPPRREYRPEPHKPVPLPRSRALPPPRMYAEREFDEIRISEPERFGDEEYHAYPERVREREVVMERKRRDSSGSKDKHRARSVRSRSVRSRSISRSSATSEDSSTSGGTTVTVKSIKSVKSEYPKKGKTRIPVRLVSKRALIDLGYPFVEEGNVLIVQKALGQQNIDDLLKLSEDYKKAEQEVTAARSVSGDLIEERREVFALPPPPPSVIAPPPPPVIHTAAPVAPSPPVEVFKETYVREISPARTARSRRSHSTSTSRTPVIIEPREYSEEVPIGPLAIVGDRRRTDQDIQMEIARLEAERDLVKRERRHHHSHSRHRSHSHSLERELVSAERLPTGELVLYEEQVEKIEEPRRGVRIEKDKKGRMSISVPKYR
ncbi:hypothetical protein F4821DRAFT_188124 [Hypoxylon rubiginosum]|uniref:Uncharacterized protein n=1 Tax=Hypoxylon rubiginosum TaxID=110542 RepID=A0ACC0DFT0_9PEZI|nr:hypothetical protein F4821DRAFT_188124 [Hypoxylon rubiginosum]